MFKTLPLFPEIPVADQLAWARLALRRMERSYPGKVMTGRLKGSQADAELACQRAICRTLERLIK